MTPKVTLTAALLALFVTANANAEDEKKSPWTSSAELGFVNTSGNTNTSTLKAVFDVSYEVDKWKHTGHADTLQADTDDIKTADKSLATYQADYKFNERDYMFGLVSYEVDKFSGFEYQAKLTGGYGRNINLTETMDLSLEAGLGYRNFTVDNAPDSEDEVLARVAAKYLWKISHNSSFNQDLLADFGELQDEYRSITALTANINTSLAMKLSFTVRFYSNVPVGNDRYDRESVVTLVYTF